VRHSQPTPGGPTPTVCPLQFSDVPLGSTFYDNIRNIRCLACRGIINGYPNGTFKPNNNISRGQLAKIVSNTAGFNDPQTTQLFQDVAPASTFFAFVGRLASRGFMSGYACGGSGEPCIPPASLPYFRPGSNATRGQISKIVSNAAGFGNPPSGQQFEDVPVNSTFYTYIYRLSSRGVMGGYPCGGTGEPCVPPANLPYFRPNNNATRGQTSKIVANTFLPDCQTPARE
jgi:S-layer homology domain